MHGGLAMRTRFSPPRTTRSTWKPTVSNSGSSLRARQPLSGASPPCGGEPPVPRNQDDPLRGFARTRASDGADEACLLPGVPRKGLRC